jgi:hypothetical protein
MILIFVFPRFSRRQRVKTFRAALDPQYAGSVAAGMMAMLVPVLVVVNTRSVRGWYSQGSLQDDTCWSVLLSENREKCMHKRNKANVIDVRLVLEPFQVEGSRVTQVIRILDTRIEE